MHSSGVGWGYRQISPLGFLVFEYTGWLPSSLIQALSLIVAFPILFVWGLWRYRNSLLFEDVTFSLDGAVRFISHFASDFSASGLQINKLPSLYPHVHMSFPVGFFDGAQQGGRCGAGVYLLIDSDHFFEMCLGGGVTPEPNDWRVGASSPLLPWNIYTGIKSWAAPC